MKKVELFKHNKTTYENITRVFEISNKCATVQPTGSGKSFLIFKLAQDNSDKTVVVFEPNKQIIGRVSEQMKEYGIENIKFFTYQKLNSQYKKGEISIENADYICLDELHRIKAKQWEQAVIAIQDKFPNAKVLGLTATPERMDGQNIVDYFGAELACNITLGDAIVNKILPCPTYISALYTFDEEIQRVNNKIDESRNSDEEKEEMREELKAARKQLENALGVPTILKKHIPDNNGKYLVFCQNVEHLNTMRPTIEDWFTQAGFDVHMYAVHTKNPNHKTEYNGFKADNSNCIKLCLCVDMFNEGVHLEGISGVILLRPTQSNIIYFQQIGRAISASDENIPIIFDLVNNGNCLGGGSLRTEIETAVGRQRTEISNVDGECENDVFDIGDFHIYDYVKDSLSVLNEIENKCIDEFNFRLKQLEEYKIKWGHCYVMSKEATEWSGLNAWAQNMRNHYKRGSLGNKTLKLLHECGFKFDNNEYKYKLLEEHINSYKKTNNNCIIPSHFVCDDGYNLGNIVAGIIRRKSGYGYEIIIKYNVCQTRNYKEDWNYMFDLLNQYVEQYNILCGKNTIYKGENLGMWYQHQLSRYKNHKMTEEQYTKFSEIGGFNRCHSVIWDNFIEKIRQCKNSGIKITSRTIYNSENIGRRLYDYKQQYKQGKFSEERYQQLLELGIDLAKEGSLM